jgi:hypothetical protein
MHGVKKEARSEEKAAEDAAKIVEFRSWLEKANTARANKDAASVLSCSEKVLVLNSSHYSMWNARKEALEQMELNETLLQSELKLTTRCLMVNPKVLRSDVVLFL